MNDDYGVKLVGRLSEMDRLRAYRRLERIRTKYERVLRVQFRRIFRGQLKTILALDSTDERSVYAAVISYSPMMQNVLEWVYTDIARDIIPMVTVGKSYGKIETKFLPVEDEYDLYAINIQEWIRRNAADKITGINESTMRDIRKILLDCESVEDFRIRITVKYSEDIIPRRASTIARTETAAASNRASLETLKSMDSARQGWKTWNTTLDDVVRDTHAELDGKRIRIEEQFEWYDQEGRLVRMDCPCDGTYFAPPGEVINCRCFLTYDAD